MQTLPARANRRHPKTAADAFFLTVFDRRSDCRKAPAVRWRATSNVWADCSIVFHPHGGLVDGRSVSLPRGTFEPSPGCGALFLLRGAEPACKKQTAAPAPPRLYLPQAAARLRSHPPTEVTPRLRRRPLTGALNHKLLLLGAGCAAAARVQPNHSGIVGRRRNSRKFRAPTGGGPAGPGEPLWAVGWD